MTETHFTAWLTNDASCLDQPCIDLTVLEDTLNGDSDDNASWVTDSGKERAFYAVTTVEADADDISEAFVQAKDLLEDANWQIVGDWEATPNAYVVTVARDDT
ncbi:hypothetical protein ACFWV1_26305 [Streptomyces sp. NPDC058700]|uniref:hypothetical protein n=1 Tax=Streptomyces sp. NPDC058700 TaxID=3346607 RepID=UPI003663D08B